MFGWLLKKSHKDIIDPRDDKFGKYNGNEIVYVSQALDTGSRSTREPFTLQLESAFKKKFGMKYAISENSGTSTLHTCLAAAGVGAGDEVICPAQTVVMTATTILHQNAIPVFADIDPETLNIDPKDIERKITPKTKAIYAVHMHGLPADMDAIMALAEKHNLVVIEDAAQCVLGVYKGRLAGSIGHMSSFSFENKKHLSAGEGGIVLTNSESYGTTIRKTAFNGYKILSAGQELRQILPSEFQDPNYKRHDTLGWNYRMNEVTAAVALAQVERMDFLVERRQKVAELFYEAIADCDWLKPQLVPEGYVSSYWSFCVLYEGEEAIGLTWKDFYNRFKDAGGNGFYGGLSVVYEELVIKDLQFVKSGYLPPVGDCPYSKFFQWQKGLCPVAERVQPKMMQFKTNYRNMDEAREQALILKELIKSLS
ncbi:DegT/DnrJ/EryC1/StrS family aminotransferase [Alphaproteobacteria bacterium]|nr:DegT/DnrJ/EryC1/StrS family aminotransferase [Alphaproteobacteria bacterium]MDB2431920.1 DegT/DnrJ/EryC1/StrS family aminotransferase [Alphaproteobacteria bacterium]MDB2575091.1 DegT/DnrJ/EryC1/StrS family aminotransferase [Alphaproteobacteria bacterium]MDB2656017.1 DegT/DnrJ/EryC1/StrS family aminotransferase [Alphaproteobacteria bacterium]